MATFSELQTEISANLEASHLASRIPTVINRAIKYYRNKPLWFTTGETTFTITSGTQDITSLLPADFLHLRSPGLVIEDNDRQYRLHPVSPSHYDAWDSNGTGRPYVYTVRNNSYYVYWKADQNYTCRITYQKKYDALVNDGDTNDFTNEAEQLIVAKSLEYLYFYDRKSFDKRLQFKDAAMDEYQSLVDETYSRLGGFGIEPEGINQDNQYEQLLQL